MLGVVRMPELRRRPPLVWAGRIMAGLIVVGLTIYLVSVGLDQADKIGSSLGVVLAAAALLLPYVVPPAQPTPGEIEMPNKNESETATGASVEQRPAMTDSQPAASKYNVTIGPNAIGVQVGEKNKQTLYSSDALTAGSEPSQPND